MIHELPGVGGNLQDHLQLRLIYKLENARTLNQIAGSVWGKMGMGLRYLYDRSGPLSMAPSQLGRVCPIRAGADLGQPRIPRATVVAGALWRAVAQLSGVHRVGVRFASAEPWAHRDSFGGPISRRR